MASPNKETNHEQDVLHLFKAISKGKAHLTRFMLAASGPTLLNCFNEEGRTPLMECCYIREEATRVSMVKCIRDAGADVNVKDDLGRTALIHACMERCNDVVRILIMHCRIIPDTEDSDGNTALIHSASNGNDIAVELLVRNFRRLGLQVDHFNKEGYSALHVAARNGFLQCAKILATKGKATLTLKDKVSNMTPMEICLAEGYQKSEVEFLKPSVKFYKVAKLTTTMVKYRKRSSTGQDSIGSVASKIAPATATVEKEKKLMSKLNILKKSKPATTNNEAGTSSNSVPTVTTTAPPPPPPTTQQPATQKSPGDKEGPADQGNSKAKRLLPLLKDMAKRSGQQKYANCSEKKSEVIRLLEDGIKKDGTVQNKISPMTKRKTDGMIDMNKANRPQKLVTSNSTTSPFTEKDFPKSEFPDDGDDVTTCSTATDVTDLDGDDRQTTPPGMPSNNNNNNSNATTAAFKINNNNNNTSSGLRQHHANNIDQRDHFSPDDQSEEFDFESISECSLPSMSSPTTQTASSSCNDDVTTSSNASSTPTPQPFPATTTSKNHSKNTGGVSISSSTSPRTEIEYIALNDDQTNPSQTGSASSNDMTTLSGSGNSDDSSMTCEEVRPNFDKLVTGHVLKAIDDDGDTKDGKDFPNSTTQNCKTGLSTNSGSENHRKNVNGVNVVTKASDENDNGQTTRADSASPATIIESLDGLSIPKDFSDRPSPKAADAGGHLGDGSIDILRYTNDSVDAKMRRVDLNESTTC